MSSDLTLARVVQEGTPIDAPEKPKPSPDSALDLIQGLVSLGIVELAQIPRQQDSSVEAILTEVLRRKMDGVP